MCFRSYSQDTSYISIVQTFVNLSSHVPFNNTLFVFLMVTHAFQYGRGSQNLRLFDNVGKAHVNTYHDQTLQYECLPN